MSTVSATPIKIFRSFTGIPEIFCSKKVISAKTVYFSDLWRSSFVERVKHEIMSINWCTIFFGSCGHSRSKSKDMLARVNPVKTLSHPRPSLRPSSAALFCRSEGACAAIGDERPHAIVLIIGQSSAYRPYADQGLTRRRGSR
uniref:Uncharacterized protein n=1 Tax=Steinernema glaseri TaxID=37863 RepID=A0A1I7ZJZ3_9BILA